MRMTEAVLLSLFFSSFIAESAESLKLICSYPKDEKKDYYFRPIISLQMKDNLIYGVENMSNKIDIFKFDNLNIEFIKNIGRPGQGPGDLQYPMSLSIQEDVIVIKENTYFSFFNTQGGYIRKIKTFSPSTVFFYNEKSIYWLNSNWKENHLIERYAESGERLSTLGDKKEILNYLISKDEVKLEKNSIFDGSLFNYNNSILYINKRFGKFIIFSFEGTILDKGDINSIFGDRGEKQKKYNYDVFVSGKAKPTQPPPYPTADIYEHAYLDSGKVYFIYSNIEKMNEDRITNIDIKILNMSNKSLVKEYSIKKNHICRINGFAVLNNDNDEYLVLSYTILEEGNYLDIYSNNH